MFKLIGTTVTFLAVIFSTAILAYFFNSERGKTFIQGNNSSLNFTSFIMKDSIYILLFILIILSVQLILGYVLNRFIDKNNVQKSYEGFVMYKAYPILYAILEFYVFYLLVILITGNVINNMDFSLEVNSPSTGFLKIILWTSGITLIIVFLGRSIAIKWLKNCLIAKTPVIEEVLKDTYNIIYNLSYLLILPLTLISIFQLSVSEQERILFFQIGIIILAAYSFQISKSAIFKYTP